MSYDPESAAPSRMIQDMNEMERPREKAMKYGLDELTDTELMAIIFATGVKGKSVIDLCKEILDANDGHLSLVAKMTVDQFCHQFKGIGPVKAITMLAALKLGERTQADAEGMAMQAPIQSSETAYKRILGKFKWAHHEEFWVMYLNHGAKVLKCERVSQGGFSLTAVDVKIIVRQALMLASTCVILFHNHPSGTLRPSGQDDALTQKIKNACALFDIVVFDHIIVTDTGYYSYADHNRL